MSALPRLGTKGSHTARRSSRPAFSDLDVSIVVPVLNEAPIIGASLRRLRRDFPHCELIVVDGGSSDGTADRARAWGRVLTSAPGRAVQMNEGARCSRGDVLWFVHADTVIDPRALEQIQEALADPGAIGGGLTLRFDRRTPLLNYLARASTVRARRLHHVFGDQAMFVRREAFERLGGFAPLPLMEDLEFSRRAHRAGRMVVLTATSTAASRRFTAHGTFRMIVFMQYLKMLFLVGVSAERIRLRYEAGPGIALPTLPGPSRTECSHRRVNDGSHAD